MGSTNFCGAHLDFVIAQRCSRAHIFRELSLKSVVLYYMDDLIILSSNEAQGIERLKLVFQIAQDYGLEIKKSKCQILKRRVNFLGFIVENGKVQPSQEKNNGS